MESVEEITGLTMDVMATRLRDVALYAHLHRISLENVESNRYEIFRNAISRILRTEAARQTYAQLVDGLPIADVAWDRRYPGIFGYEHPIEDHNELCPGAEQKISDFIQDFDVNSLLFDPKLIQAYQNANIGSKAFNTRLVELVAVALHQIAAYLFKRRDLYSHDEDEIKRVTDYVMPRPLAACDTDREGAGWVDVPPRPTLFNHAYYLDHDIYPEGIADIAGYWAEDRIIGGVVLFDRRADPRAAGEIEDAEVDNGDTLPNIWVHPGRDRVTERIYQLRDEQQKAIFDYLLAEDEKENPLPILPDRHNRTRLDSSIAHTHKRVYRDPWDRKPFTQEELRFLERRPQDEGDYPEIRDMMNHMEAELAKQEAQRDSPK
ncbi:hypothetical protein J7T55_006063 [Diaporthe amygdali]|uniref:uncharacterized protein n=1 Tax=Phomopsis amygdali TaxID=1214568 RepID=UPI0022FEEBDA|nr:uncharacterized protein J7T55_006063 [Diaporthe amygdali]KAJ0124722.1 hypothetical protein J7T55_006063 [Diaporthe amygdali]